ncbi:MAG: type VI secretion system baseplate subunit TssG, partial [Longimicrobiales bacterium]
MESTPVGRECADGLERVAKELERRPTSFDFFQAVRLLERLHPERAAVGDFVEPSTEVVHFGVNPSIAFPASDVFALATSEDGDAPAHMTVNFMGLVGPAGVLPYEYSLLATERRRAKDGALLAFFDLFHHRIISLFYRAWRKYRFTADYE